MPKTVLSIYSLLKKSFFSQTPPWANKSKILSAGLPEANRSVSKKVLSLRDYLSVKEGRCGMQASEHSLTAPALNKIFVWLRSVFLTATLKKCFFIMLWLKIKNNFILCVRPVTIFDRFLLKLLLF